MIFFFFCAKLNRIVIDRLKSLSIREMRCIRCGVLFLHLIRFIGTGYACIAVARLVNRRGFRLSANFGRFNTIVHTLLCVPYAIFQSQQWINAFAYRFWTQANRSWTALVYARVCVSVHACVCTFAELPIENSPFSKYWQQIDWNGTFMFADVRISAIIRGVAFCSQSNTKR